MTAKFEADRQRMIDAVAAAATPAASVATPAPAPKPAPSYAPTQEQSILISQARVAGALHERRRIEAILSCKEAEGREALALHFALKTDFDLKAAQIALAASPVGLSKSEMEYNAGAAAGRALLGK